VPNKWLEWTPDRDEVIAESSMYEPSNPLERGFDGFDGHPSGLFHIIHGHEGHPRFGADVIEKAVAPAPSKPSEPPADSAKAHLPDILPRRPATCALTCYEIEPGRWIHHPWDGCKNPMPSREPYLPPRADCGCDGRVCSKCFLCPEHCHCLSNMWARK